METGKRKIVEQEAQINQIDIQLLFANYIVKTKNFPQLNIDV